jgi:hypothetical protein
MLSAVKPQPDGKGVHALLVAECFKISGCKTYITHPQNARVNVHTPRLSAGWLNACIDWENVNIVDMLQQPEKNFV